MKYCTAFYIDEYSNESMHLYGKIEEFEELKRTLPSSSTLYFRENSMSLDMAKADAEERERARYRYYAGSTSGCEGRVRAFSDILCENEDTATIYKKLACAALSDPRLYQSEWRPIGWSRAELAAMALTGVVPKFDWDPTLNNRDQTLPVFKARYLRDIERVKPVWNTENGRYTATLECEGRSGALFLLTAYYAVTPEVIEQAGCYGKEYFKPVGYSWRQVGDGSVEHKLEVEFCEQP